MTYIEALREKVGNDPVILVRPSVLIVSPQGEILLVRHIDNTWGIPGGHMELGESAEECAIREIEEEIGIKLKNGHEYYSVVIAAMLPAR